MRENNGQAKERFGVIIDGKLYGSRAIRQKIGSQKKSEILKVYPNAKFVKQKSKDRYFLFRGSKKTQECHRQSIEKYIKPYPKRAGGEGVTQSACEAV